MAEIRDGTVKEVLEKFWGLSDDIEEINRRFDTVDRTGDTLEDLRIRVDNRKNEMTDLKTSRARLGTLAPTEPAGGNR